MKPEWFSNSEVVAAIAAGMADGGGSRRVITLLRRELGKQWPDADARWLDAEAVKRAIDEQVAKGALAPAILESLADAYAALMAPWTPAEGVVFKRLTHELQKRDLEVAGVDLAQPSLAATTAIAVTAVETWTAPRLRDLILRHQLMAAPIPA